MALGLWGLKLCSCGFEAVFTPTTTSMRFEDDKNKGSAAFEGNTPCKLFFFFFSNKYLPRKLHLLPHSFER